MKYRPEPAVPPLQAIEDAYGRGYLAGHLAGWRDALAAQKSAAVAASQAGAESVQQGSTPTAQAAGSARATQTAAGQVRSTAVEIPPAPPHAPAAAMVSGSVPLPAALPPASLPPTSLPPAARPVRVSLPSVPLPSVPLPSVPLPSVPLPSVPLPSVPLRSVSAAPVPRPQQLPRGLAGAAARKQKRETQNINIALYAASLLMVAAAALFVGSSLPAAARWVGVWLGTAAFYAAGLIIHSRVARLKPAAVAFTGTALAIIPFAGIATYNLGFSNGAGVWLFTSLVGTVAYVVAAVRMQSRLIVYTSLAFLLSTIWSSTAVLGAALAWYFAALIVLSALSTILGQVLARRGKAGHRAAALYAKPLTDLGPWFAPAGIIASLVVGSALNAADHLLVLVAGAIYFAVFFAIPAHGSRAWNYVGLRVCLTLAAPFMGWLFQPTLVWVAGAFTLGLAIQTLLLVLGRRHVRGLASIATWTGWDLAVAVPAVAVGGMLWTLGLNFGGTSAFTVWGLAVALLVGMVTVPALPPRGEWLPAPALVAVLASSPLFTALEWTVLLGILLGYCIVKCLTAKNGRWKQAWLVGARLVLSAFIASALAAFIPLQPGKTAFIVTAVAVLAALQLMLDAVLVRTGKANPFTLVSAFVWAASGTFLVILLSVAASNNSVFSGWAVGSGIELRGEFLVAVIVMGCAAMGYSAAALRSRAAGSAGEVVGPLYLMVVSPAMGAVFHAGGASVAWAVTVGYLLAFAIRLRGIEEGLHRWCYWWAARLGCLALTVALFQLWAEFDPTTSIAGTQVGLGPVITAAILPQLVILAGTVVKRRPYPWLNADITITLALVIFSAGAWAPGSSSGSWIVVVMVPALSVVLALLMVSTVLIPQRMPTAQWAAPAALLITALFVSDDPDAFTTVLGVIVLTASFLAAKAGNVLLRSFHLLLARVAVTALAGAVAELLHGSVTVVSLVLCGALLGQVLVHWVILKSAVLRARVGHLQLLGWSLWCVLAAQLVLPVAYLAASGGFRAPVAGMRWVMVVEWAILVFTAVAAQLTLKQRGAAYLSIIAVAGAAAVVAPTVWPGATAMTLMALCVAMIVWRSFSTPSTPEMQWFWLVAIAGMLFTAHIVDSAAAPGVFASMWLVAGVALLAATELMTLPWLTLPGALLVFVAGILFREQVLDLTDSTGFSALAGLLVVTGTLYMVRLIMVDLGAGVVIARSGLTASALVGGGIFALWSMADHDTVLLGAAAFTALAIAACFEASTKSRSMVIDGAIVGCAVVWFWACSSYIDLGAFWSVQWCAMALGALSVKRYVNHQQMLGKKLLMGAAVLASAGALITIFNGDTWEQVISLVIFVVLLIVGMSLEERVFTVWGAVGVATAVLWYLRDFTYVLLAFLALSLIAFAIWRLTRSKPVSSVEE